MPNKPIILSLENAIRTIVVAVFFLGLIIGAVIAWIAFGAFAQ